MAWDVDYPENVPERTEVGLCTGARILSLACRPRTRLALYALSGRTERDTRDNQYGLFVHFVGARDAF